MLYGCTTWSPRPFNCDTLRRIHHRVLYCGIGWQNHNHNHTDILTTPRLPTLTPLWRHGARALTCPLCRVSKGKENRTLLECLVFRVWFLRGHSKYRHRSGTFWMTSELSAFRPTSERSQLRTRGNVGIKRSWVEMVMSGKVEAERTRAARNSAGKARSNCVHSYLLTAVYEL